MSALASTSVGAIGQDTARATITAAFSAVRDDADNAVPELIADDAWATPTWREAALEYHKHRGNRASIAPYAPEEIARLHRLMADNVSLERAWAEIARPSGAAASTVEALVYQLRRGGTELSNPNARRRLLELSEQQLHEVSARLQKFMPHIARAWSPSEVELLVQLWSDLHG
jgi:hypothetical protein